MKTTFPTLNAAASALGIPKSTLSRWKSAGASGFSQAGRVNLGALLQWLAKNQGHPAEPVDVENARAQLNLARAAKIQKELDSDDEDQLDASAVHAAVESELARIIDVARKQAGDYMLTVQGVDVIDRRELEHQRKQQAEFLAGICRHSLGNIMRDIGKTPSGEPNIIAKFEAMKQQMQEASRRAWKDLAAVVPAEHLGAVERWASMLMGTALEAPSAPAAQPTAEVQRD